jgi:hypothetical protein
MCCCSFASLPLHSLPNENDTQHSDNGQTICLEGIKGRKRLNSVWDHFILVQAAPDKNSYGKALCMYCKDGYEKANLQHKLVTARPRNMQSHLRMCPFLADNPIPDVSAIRLETSCSIFGFVQECYILIWTCLFKTGIPWDSCT